MRVRPLDPRKLDVELFARDAERLEGTVALRSLPRLLDACQPEARTGAGEREVQWQASGQQRTPRGADAQPWLHLQAKVTLPLECQRCLGAVESPIEVDRWFHFARSEAEAAQLDAEAEEDVLALSRSFDLIGLLEDEVLLALPLVPRHETCAVIQPSVPEMAADAGEEEPRTNPFEVLAALKREPGNRH